MVKAILFDLDNTLMDFLRMKHDCISAAVFAMIGAGLPVSADKAKKVLYNIYDKHGMEYKHVFEDFLKVINKKIDYRILAAGIIAYRKAQISLIEPYPNVIPTLIKLRERGYKLAIVSDAPRLKAWIRLVELKLDHFFDLVVAFGDVKERKPSRIPFEKALKELKLKPEEVMMVGDQPAKDVGGARKLGMQTCFALYGYEQYNKTKKLNVKADHIINDISELTKILK